ncbi:histidine phosphatase family protein [Frankia sp. Cppng1_Ct_nod]|uniref:histidine phosphatase family protein n=1 Tax=Frankia sp. Cppng1_Ct_nod TaxID=2897162 RepID=UPI002025036A|nr:histidine phosphatase family protein [Frankia sp. Cppng1_Ct_nod]
MTTVLLVRHGLTAVTGSVLLGWTPGVGLDDRGRQQAQALAQRLASVPLTAIVSSPLQRCQETALAIAEHQGEPKSESEPWDDGPVVIDDRLGECRYGDWTGQEMKTLAKDPLWRTVQEQPSAVVFPGPDGEALRDTQYRAVAAVRDWNTRLGPDAVWLACSHGDVIKSIVADAMGMHLDLFQRISVDPCSLTVIQYTERRPFVIRVNDRGGIVADLLPAPRASGDAADGDAVVGGGAGTT